MQRLPVFQVQALNLRGRSPFGTMIGIPVANSPAPKDISTNQNGDVLVGGVPIGPGGLSPSQALIAPPPSLNPQETVEVFDTSLYGDAITTPIAFAGAGERIVLQRPNQIRTSLLIQNLNIAGGIFYCFDRTADNVSCIQITSGGNRLFDTSVPQGDLHIFSSGAGTVVIEYMNKRGS